MRHEVVPRPVHTCVERVEPGDGFARRIEVGAVTAELVEDEGELHRARIASGAAGLQVARMRWQLTRALLEDHVVPAVPGKTRWVRRIGGVCTRPRRRMHRDPADRVHTPQPEVPPGPETGLVGADRSGVPGDPHRSDRNGQLEGPVALIERALEPVAHREGADDR